MKTSFKIILDSYNTNSWIGILHGAKYSINLRNILPNPEDYNKRYYMTVKYEMESGLFATSTLSPNNNYYLNIDVGKSLNILYNNNASTGVPINPRNNVALLQFHTDLYNWTGTSAPTYAYLECNPSDNLGVIVDDIKNINHIKLTLYDGTNEVIFNSANTSAINDITQYICVLQFEEI